MLDVNPHTLRSTRSTRGFTLIELLIVIAITGILTAIAIPQLLTQRRLLRSTALPRDIVTKLRYARQLAISTRQSITFQYDDSTKVINIFNHHNNGPVTAQFPISCSQGLGGKAILGAAGYPNTACATPDGFTDHSTPLRPYPLTQGGLTVAEITYGIPAGSPPLPTGAPVIPVTKLDDSIVMTPLASGKLNITFQPDGTVIDAAGLPTDRAMYFFNPLAAQSTATAISVVGASGRAKIWRYNLNGNNFVE